MYNQSLTGDVSKTMNSRATDSDHVPCVIVFTNVTYMAVGGDIAPPLLSRDWKDPPCVLVI